MAVGNSPALMAKNVGQGSQYLWTYRDANGRCLDGAKSYRLHIVPNIPAKNFCRSSFTTRSAGEWQRLPSISSYSKPHVNADGSIDIFFGPKEPKEKRNWIRTVPGKGSQFFPFYGPTDFDKTWKL